MRFTRAVAGLLLLALVLGAQAGNRCANCGLGEGTDACHCGNTAVRAKKLTKPDLFVSPEAIKDALELKKAYNTPTPTSSASASVYGGSPVPAPISLYSALPAPSPLKNRRDKDLKNLLRLTAGVSIAPKFEPIGDLCHSCKGYKSDVVGVVPARPGKLPCKCRKSESEDKSSPTPAPLAAYSAPDAAYSAPAPSYGAPASSLSAPAASYAAAAPAQSNPAPLYAHSTALAQYAPAYQAAAPASYLPPPAPVAASAPAQYASAYQQASPVIYVAASSSPARGSYADTEPTEPQPRCNCKSKQNVVTATPTVGQYAAAYQRPAPVVCEAEPAATAKRSYKKSNPQPDYEAPLAKRSYRKSKSEPPCNCNNKLEATATPATYATPAQYDPAPVNYVAAPPTSAKAPCDKSNTQSDYDKDKDEREAEAYVEIVLQEEQTPTADPVSISLAYKNLAESHGKKYVAEDSLAYGHYKEPADGRVCKHVSNFDEEKLHTVDKPVVELKDCECRNGNCQNLQVSYSDIGYGPVAPSKNRFVPKTDDASNSPYGQSIIYVPPPEDKDSLPCGTLGPTIPGYKSGGVVVSDQSSAKSTCGCAGTTPTVEEGSRQAVLVEDDEYDGDSYNGKAGIIERIKSSACKSGY